MNSSKESVNHYKDLLVLSLQRSLTMSVSETGTNSFSVFLMDVDVFVFQYSLAGDDTVTEAVNDLVRGTLCPALKAIFQHGLKKPSILGGPCHPWLFIEEVSVTTSYFILTIYDIIYS